MSLHTYQNQNAFSVGIAQRDGTHRWFLILGPGASIVLENDPTKARPFNPTNKQWVAYSTLTDLGPFAPTLPQCEDPSTWAET